jgi:serine/threonine protein kinase
MEDSPPYPFKIPVIADYKPIRVIGTGSFGQVWIALDATGSPCALKIIHKGKFDNEVFWKEFEGVKNYLPISRGNMGLVTILHVGKDPQENFYYYTMELADNANDSIGEDWKEYEALSLSLQINRIQMLYPLDKFEEIAINLADGLAHLHENGLVHRDIKPSNVIFINGKAKLADVGLVTKGVEASTFIGTAGYIPPEGPGMPAADVYALGKTLYELLTGKNIREFPELPTKIFSDKSETNKFARYNMIVVESTYPDYRDRPADGRQLANLFSRETSSKSSVKRGKPKRKKGKIGFFPFLVVMTCLGFLISSFVFYNQSQKPLNHFKFKHFRYYESTGSELLDGKYEIQGDERLSVECHFAQGILRKAQASIDGKLHSVLFFDMTQSIGIEEDAMSDWARNLSLLILGDPFSSFAHKVELVRQFGENGSVITEASFQNSLIRNATSKQVNGAELSVSRGEGRLLWHGKDHAWSQKYRNGRLVKSIHSQSKATHSFQSNDENLQEVHEVSFSNGESIRMLTEKTEVPGNYQKSTEHKIGVKTLFLTVDQYEGDSLVRTESVALDENNLEARLVTEYVYDDFAQVPRVNKGQVQFSLLLKLPN